MSTPRKVFLVCVSAFGLCVLGWVLVLGAVYAWGGVITVKVDNPDGPNLSIPVPAAIVEAALTTGELTSEKIRSELGEFGPMLAEVFDVLDECPDMTLVEVEDRGDHVRISKEGGRLKVRVQERGSQGVEVEVSFPTRTIARLVS